MRLLKKGFSIVEVIITISIIIILSIVASTSYSSFQNKAKNSKVSADVKTLENSVLSYIEEQKDLFMPKGNLKFYSSDTGYTHDYDDEKTFGVSGYITEDVISKKYLNLLPLDPRTNQYYAFGRVKNGTGFEISGVTFENDEPSSIVSGNWTGETGLYSLVKEYLGPNFVYDKSKQYFPYNPEENVITAKINSFSGTIKINNKTYNDNQILSYTLGEGDAIKVGTGGFANIYYSDGSESALGDNSTQSELKLSNMKLKGENNLFTSIRLSLDMGSIWTKAVQLDEKSEFQIDTTDAVAAVRGTIFGVRKDKSNPNTNIVVIRGKVGVNRVGTDGAVAPVGNNIEVLPGEQPEGTQISPGGTSVSSTGAINKAPEEIEKRVIENVSYINDTMKINYTYSGSIDDFELTLKLDNSAFKNASYLKIETIYGDRYLKNLNWQNKDELVLPGGIEFKDTLSDYATATENKSLKDISKDPKAPFRFCDRFGEREICSKELEIDFKNIASSVGPSEIVVFGSEQVKNTLYASGYDLVAYAGYNNAGDLNMRDLNMSNLDVGSGDIIPNSKDLPYDVRNSTEDYNIGKSFVKMKNGVKGIYIDNNESGDFLKYDISSLDLTSGKDFAVEISVRGAALKREGNDGYHLWDFYGLGIGLRKFTSIDAASGEKKHYLGLGKKPDHINGIMDFKSEFDKFNDNDFYKIITYFTGFSINLDNTKIEILDKNDDVISLSNCNSEKCYATGSIDDITNLYIGSKKKDNVSNKYESQWNDIIDYVKIYKK